MIASNIPGVLLIVFFALIDRFYLKPAAEQFMDAQEAVDSYETGGERRE